MKVLSIVRIVRSSLQAMMTGEHSEVTGVMGAEVRQDGYRLTPEDQDFWSYSPNTSTLWVRTVGQSL